MPNILAIETSSEACSLAVSNGDRTEVCHEVIPQQHTEKLLPLIDFYSERAQKGVLNYLKISGVGSPTEVSNLILEKIKNG